MLQDAQLVVQFGGSLTGKRLLQWQAQCRPEEYWVIDELPGRLDPAQHRGRRLRAGVRSGWRSIRRNRARRGPPGWRSWRIRR